MDGIVERFFARSFTGPLRNFHKPVVSPTPPVCGNLKHGARLIEVVLSGPGKPSRNETHECVRNVRTATAEPQVCTSFPWARLGGMWTDGRSSASEQDEVDGQLSACLTSSSRTETRKPTRQPLQACVCVCRTLYRLSMRLRIATTGLQYRIESINVCTYSIFNNACALNLHAATTPSCSARCACWDNMGMARSHCMRRTTQMEVVAFK